MVSLHPCKPPRAWVPPAGKLRGVHLLMSPASAGMQRSISTMQAQNSAYLVVPNFSVPGSAQRWCGFRDWEVVGSLRASSEQAFAEALEHGSKSTMQLHKLRTFGTFLEYSPQCLALHSWRIAAPPAGRRRSSWPLAFGCCAI